MESNHHVLDDLGVTVRCPSYWASVPSTQANVLIPLAKMYSNAFCVVSKEATTSAASPGNPGTLTFATHILIMLLLETVDNTTGFAHYYAHHTPRPFNPLQPICNRAEVAFP